MRCSVSHRPTLVRGILRRLPTSTLMGLAFTLPAMLISGLVLFYHSLGARQFLADEGVRYGDMLADQLLSASDRKSTRLNSSHLVISYAVFCLKKKKKKKTNKTKNRT